MDRAFPPLLSAAIAAAGLTRASFAHQVGRSTGYVYGVASGKRFKPPTDADELRLWCQVLGLSGTQAEGFCLAAVLDQAHPLIRAHLASLHAHLDRLTHNAPHRPARSR